MLHGYRTYFLLIVTVDLNNLNYIKGQNKAPEKVQFYFEHKDLHIFCIPDQLGLLNRFPSYFDGTFKLVNNNNNYIQVFILSVKIQNHEGTPFALFF